MGVYIKGMKEPKDCQHCWHHFSCPYYQANCPECFKDIRCPIIGIPTPHGDLIDRDALMDDVKRDTEKVINEGDIAGSFWLGYAAGLVIKKQAVIEAEKEGK